MRLQSRSVNKNRAMPDSPGPFGKPSLTFTVPATGELWTVYEPPDARVQIDGKDLSPGSASYVLILPGARAIISAGADWMDIGEAIRAVSELGKEADNAAA